MRHGRRFPPSAPAIIRQTDKTRQENRRLCIYFDREPEFHNFLTGIDYFFAIFDTKVFQPKKFSLMNYNLSTSKGGGNSTYLPPVIETIGIETEKGFATSPTPPDVYDDWGSGGGAGGIGSGSEHEL